ncbi:multidrug efflux pump subunit AcrB [Desulfobaculum xiamenense]|uniref:Multidrug efflux pump subunit AcrB n=1 Tax=Desulfobaculum xiamenense TaxID=995050 RepID=A0A846QHH0_9BACT|nr:efflux RND transporter permease subunit [Desulfobaculum xiamenense]NJB67718.1 multidrug efflux pump subunit AcrB [Desulfobaculum xiamenense]
MRWLNAVIAFFAEHPTAANLLMGIFLFMGALTVSDLRRETFPDFTAPEVEVSVVYPGATAEEVENAICQRVEDAVDGVTGVYEVRSEAREGLGRVVVEMVEGGDMPQFIDDVRTEVEAIDDFPDEAEDPVIKQLGRTDPVVSVAVTGPMPVSDLKLYCEDLKDRMQLLPQVSQIDILGFSDHQLRISIPAAVLMQHGLSADDVARRIAARSVDLPAGSVETRDADVLVRFGDERRGVRELEDLTIFSGATGAELRLGDIARITDTFELDEQKIVFDGMRAGMLQINKTKGEDALRIMDAVSSFLERERLAAPPTVHFTLTRNVSKIVRDRLQMLVINGFEGLALVFLTMWLFFAFRFSFWVSMGLPVSFLGAAFALDGLGLSLNMISMVGLLMATGLLMDDAIVIAENVAAHMAAGKSARLAAVDGTAEVVRGVFSSFATTVLIFGTIALLIRGDIGKVLWVMPVVLIITLGVSLVEAFFILPHHLAHSLCGHEHDTRSRFREGFDALFVRLREEGLGRAVDWAVRWRYAWVAAVFATFLLSIGMIAGGRLKVRAFPEIDGDVLEARVLMPQGTPLAQTEAVAGRVEQALSRVNDALRDRQPDGRDLVEHVNVQYSVNNDSGEQGPHLVTVSADLLSAEERDGTIDEISELWRGEVGTVPDAVSITYKEPALGPGGMAIDIRLQGPDLHRLSQASNELLGWLGGYDGVLDLMGDLRPGKPEIRVRLREGALALGIDAATVARQLRAAFHGLDAAEVQAGAESYAINVQFPAGDQDSLADLDGFHVTAADGTQVPLSVVATLEEGRGFARIARVDGVRTVTIRGDVDLRRANAREVVADTGEHFMPGLLERYPEIGLSLEGQARETKRTGGSLLRALGIGVFGIFVLLSFQFRSYIEPVVVISAIPLAFIGVVWGHLLMGQELAMPSIMGFVSLAGVVVNDSILLVEFIKIRMADGQRASEAARVASRGRFRAVVLTSMTTIMGLVPLLLERSLQAQILIPLCISIVFGLLASTVLVLLVVPALYAILADLGLTNGDSPP